MFGKTKETEELPGDLTVDQFFGDEAAAAEVVRMDELRERVEHVEQQLSSQFTSLAAYAQIAQEQIETARSEAKHAAERTERKVIELIERERHDRISAIGSAPEPTEPGSPVGWTAPGVDHRLDALERSVAQIQHGLNECLARQKTLADAITALFEPQLAQPVTAEEPSALCASLRRHDDEPLPAPAVEDDAISELSIL